MKHINIHLEEADQDVYVGIPEHQLEEWDRDADAADMSRSRFIRVCVEAGRKQLAALNPSSSDTDGMSSIKDDILKTVADNDGISTDDLVGEVVAPIEDDIYEQIEELDNVGRISYSPREGGYVLER